MGRCCSQQTKYHATIAPKIERSIRFTHQRATRILGATKYAAIRFLCADVHCHKCGVRGQQRCSHWTPFLAGANQASSWQESQDAKCMRALAHDVERLMPIDNTSIPDSVKKLHYLRADVSQSWGPNVSTYFFKLYFFESSFVRHCMCVGRRIAFGKWKKPGAALGQDTAVACWKA